jgi:predicted alpha/beta-fold hydrolase
MTPYGAELVGGPGRPRRLGHVEALGTGVARRRGRAAALSVLILALSVGCTGLRPLPRPTLAPCPAAAGTQDLWRCLDDVDRLVGAGIGDPQPHESAYRGTTRMVDGDLRRKFGDLSPAHACGGAVPAGFVRVPEVPAMEPVRPGRAPLEAYFHPPRRGMATILVVHGLFDSKHVRYVRLTAAFLAAQGFGVLVPDMRWHGCLYRWLPTLGIEEGKDLLAWREWVRGQAPESPVGLVGFSLGALDVIQALALDADGDAFAAGGVVVSPPANLPLTLVRLDDPPSLADQGMLSFVQRFFLNGLRRRLHFMAEALPRRDAAGPPFDPQSERPFAGILPWLSRQPPFPPGTTPESLLALADPLPALARIRRPLVIVASRRDPIFSELAFVDLAAAAAKNPSLHLLATTDGGHIGQLGRYPQWTADLLARFFRASPDVPPPVR